MTTQTKQSLALVRGLRVAAAAFLTTLAAQAASAQAPTAQRVGDDSWRLGASVGILAPRSSLVIASAGGTDTRLSATPSFALDVQYIYSPLIAIYGNGLVGFSTLTRGSTFRLNAGGPSDDVTMLGATGGIVVSPAWFGEVIRPTLRLGGGYKGYLFDIVNVDGQWRPTGDIGVGFRAGGNGPIEISAEARYLPSSFDQGKLLLRSVVPQAQRQSDLLFGIGVSIRP